MDAETQAELAAKYPQLNEAQLTLISGEAYERGHYAGQAEVNLIARNLAAFVADILKAAAPVGGSVFYLAKLVNRHGEFIAATEVWGWSALADKAKVAKDAGKEFERAMDDVDGNTILIYGPFTAEDRPAAFAMSEGTTTDERGRLELAATPCDIPPDCGWPNQD